MPHTLEESDIQSPLSTAFQSLPSPHQWLAQVLPDRIESESCLHETSGSLSRCFRGSQRDAPTSYASGRTLLGKACGWGLGEGLDPGWREPLILGSSLGNGHSEVSEQTEAALSFSERVSSSGQSGYSASYMTLMPLQ